MGDCTFCGKSAGLLRSKHAACLQQHDSALAEIVSHATAGASGEKAPADANSAITQLAQNNFVGPGEVQDALTTGFENAVDHMLDDHLISEDEETSLNAYAKVFNLSRDTLDRTGAATRVAQGAALRELAAGEIPTRLKVEGDLPFNFQKSEELVWAFSGVDFYEERTRREFKGGSTGASVRVMKGVYLRQSAFRGHPVTTTEMVHIDSGTLAFTTKHLYFSGGRKSHRTPYTKIVSFQPYSDGLGVQRDAATAKPQIYGVGGDGWFVYNLARNLAAMAA